MTAKTFLAFLLTALSVVSLPDAGAAPKQAAIRARKPVAVQAAPVQSAHRRSPYVGALSVNAETGAVLFEENADAEAYPASVTKLMTMLLVLEDVMSGRYSLQDKVTATEEVWLSEPSSVGLKVGESMTVDDLLMALMVKSANDAAVVLGVHASGSFDSFVARMNARARELGMSRTRYYNPNGLPPTHSTKNGVRKWPWWPNFNVSTARDQLRLAQVLVKMPQVFKYTSTKIAEVTDGQGKPLKFVNHNNVLVKDKKKIVNSDGKEAVDGLKTGYTFESGSSIVLTGTRKGKRAIVVVLGSASSDERDDNARRLLDDALGTLSW